MPFPVFGGSGSTVAFVKTDGTTQGTWKGTYGSEGYAIASDSTSLPSDVQLAVSGQSLWTWAAAKRNERRSGRRSLLTDLSQCGPGSVSV